MRPLQLHGAAAAGSDRCKKRVKESNWQFIQLARRANAASANQILHGWFAPEVTLSSSSPFTSSSSTTATFCSVCQTIWNASCEPKPPCKVFFVLCGFVHPSIDLLAKPPEGELVKITCLIWQIYFFKMGLGKSCEKGLYKCRVKQSVEGLDRTGGRGREARRDEGAKGAEHLIQIH